MAFNVGTEATSKKAATGQGGYGTGKLGEKTFSTAGTIINNYTRVTGIAGKTITIGGKTSSGFGEFAAGEEILIHCVAYTGTKEYCGKRGKWKICRIKSVAAGGVLTLDQSVQSTFLNDPDLPNAATMDNLVIQAITIPHFTNVTLEEGGVITCPAFTDSNKYGGVVVFKCSGELTFNGGHIDLTEKGISIADMPTYWSAGWVNNENPTSSKERISAGWENFRTTKHLTLNCPTGAAMVIAKTINCDSNKKSRIGRIASTGVARTRVTSTNGNLGGASILIAAETINSWTPTMIAKFSINGTVDPSYRGQARCYIATESQLPTDEGLYALDRISNPSRMADIFNLNGIQFGNGKTQRVDNYAGQLNSYAKVTAIASSGSVITIDEGSQYAAGYAQFTDGALILLHATQNGTSGLKKESGRCMFARIKKIQNKQITLDDAAFKKLEGGIYDLKKYFVQAIAVPEFPNWGEHIFNSATPKFNTAYGGGIAVVAVKGSCNLTDGGIIVEGKGNAGVPYGAKGLDFIGNAQMADRLPLGEGHGSVLILANTLKMNTSTRIGASYSGKPLGGINYNYELKAGDTIRIARSGTTRTITQDGDPQFTKEQAWQRGELNEKEKRTLAEFQYGYSNNSGIINMVNYIEAQRAQGHTGGGNGGGFYKVLDGYSEKNIVNGGFGSNAVNYVDEDNLNPQAAAQGAHVLIIANSIEGFCIDAISTGGEGGKYYRTDIRPHTDQPVQTNSAGDGGASYGGAGGTFDAIDGTAKGVFRGGNGGFIGGGGGAVTWGRAGSGGGSGGFCFVYCNEISKQNTDGISLD